MPIKFSIGQDPYEKFSYFCCNFCGRSVGSRKDITDSKAFLRYYLSKKIPNFQTEQVVATKRFASVYMTIRLIEYIGRGAVAYLFRGYMGIPLRQIGY
jgi:hypothetical protein